MPPDSASDAALAAPPMPADPYALVYTDSGRASRKALPPGALAALPDVVDALADNPDGFPGRTRPISRNGSIRVYSHPAPAFQVTFEVDSERRVLYLQHFVAPQVQATRPVFISYSHQDSAWLAKLKQFLQPLEDRELIRVWDDTEIAVGADWLSEIRAQLASARVAVFLVTQSFLASPFIRNEELPALLKAAQDRGCLIFWIAVSTSTFEDSPLAKIQGANPPGQPLDLLPEPEQNRVLAELYRKLKDAVAPG
ncbi:toll/interleukin-1 receptor domain-containing protein [Ideonella sp. DXS22W]|uniref:Toll/interleukin-1 receptor domain-containing protein n=1 Tax=Pseudaquabacterium inlustre TaxID=2984192 RepID=A0ABU9CFW2_9BURK